MRLRSKVSHKKSGDTDTKVEPKKGKGKAAAVSQPHKKPTMEGKWSLLCIIFC